VDFPTTLRQARLAACLSSLASRRGGDACDVVSAARECPDDKLPNLADLTNSLTVSLTIFSHIEPFL